jgi:hypothetical protein
MSGKKSGKGKRFFANCRMITLIFGVDMLVQEKAIAFSSL